MLNRQYQEEEIIDKLFQQAPNFDKLQNSNSLLEKLKKVIDVSIRIKLEDLKRYRRKMAGEVGFEPTNGETKTRCLTAWRLPKRRSNLSKYPNWDLLKNTTKNNFFAVLIAIFLFSSACQAQNLNVDSSKEQQTKIIARTNTGSSIDNLRHFKKNFLYTSQNELFYAYEKTYLPTLANDDFTINNLIVSDDDFFLLSSNGVYKNFKKIFNKEPCFHLEKNNDKVWISCQSGIYSSKINSKNTFNWELDTNSPQGCIHFKLDKNKKSPLYAASSQFGFFKKEKKAWVKSNKGLTRNPDGDYGFARFLVTNINDQETIFLPTSYGIAISNNQAQNFFLDSQGLETQNGIHQIKEINSTDSHLILISNTGAYYANKNLIPKWQKFSLNTLRKSEDNFINITALEITNNIITIASAQGEIAELQLAPLTEKSSPIYSQAAQLIENFLKLEPSIIEVHKKALEFAGIPSGNDYKKYAKKVRLRNFAPRFESYIERDQDSLTNLVQSGKDEIDDSIYTTSFDQENQSRNNKNLNTGIRFTWDFAKLIFDEEQLDINNNARLTANIRENLLTEVTQLYYERKNNLSQAIAWITNPVEIKSSQEILNKKLELEKTLADLDARTGAWYSSTLNHNLNKFYTQDPQTQKAMELYQDVKIN